MGDDKHVNITSDDIQKMVNSWANSAERKLDVDQQMIVQRAPQSVTINFNGVVVCPQELMHNGSYKMTTVNDPVIKEWDESKQDRMFVKVNASDEGNPNQTLIVNEPRSETIEKVSFNQPSNMVVTAYDAETGSITIGREEPKTSFNPCGYCKGKRVITKEEPLGTDAGKPTYKLISTPCPICGGSGVRK